MAIIRFLTSKDILLGLLYIGIGLLYGIYSLADLPIGTPLNMGPGYFPIALSGLLIVIGFGVLIPNLANYANRPFGRINVRSVVAILAAVMVFAILVRGAGMVIASAATVVIASFASRYATVRATIVTTILLTVFCTVVFIYGLKLPIGLFGTWFR